MLSIEDNLALIGVSVQEKGTGNGITTDVSGNFRLEVASGDAVLLFRYVGFSNQEIPVQGQGHAFGHFECK
ncbi:MAG: carboxypeptidase-like regulatory domain-containing protein [Lewinellaceae bacterium]|nr:carboxypeptidase-like regulatory domain-containing protein [Lewinellaceae bacterium]